MNEVIEKIEREMTFISDNYITYRFHTTKKYTQTKIQVIEQLPDRFYYPKRKKTIALSSNGITIKENLLPWNKVLLTGIKTWGGQGDYGPRTKHSFLIALISGEIIEIDLRPGFFDYEISEFESAVEIYKNHQI